MTRLALDHVTFWYPATNAPALHDVSLEVGAGEIVAVVGNVGSGASTLLLVAADLAPRVIGGKLDGRVHFEGRGKGEGGRGIVLPTPWTQVSGMAFTVWDEVAFGPANLGWSRDVIARHVDRALAQLDVAHLAARDPATLSGGELQRVMIAGILAMDPALLLLDEPTAELDPAGARVLWDVVRGLAREGTSVLVATSELDAIPELADRVMWLEHGRVAGAGTPVLLADERLCATDLGTTVAATWRAAGLAAPYPLIIADAVHRFGGAR